MDHAARALQTAHVIYARANSTADATDSQKTPRPPVYKAVGISLAIASGVFIGISFVLKKVGLLRANAKYNEVAGEGYGYLKNAYWWGGMTLMIIGEICNFVAYAFVDAILVTPLGALSVVITTILSAIFLKERLSLIGKVGCFLCIVGSVVIVMNAPEEASADTIQEMQHFMIAPGFLTYAGIIIVGSIFTALWVAPRYAKKSMLVYLSICSFVGGLSVVATQGLGAAILTQIRGTPQFNQWFLYVLLVFVVCTLVTEIIYLNKALNIYNAALVTPTYYVFFTSATIITSAILFRGFKGTATSIITVVMGFFVICAGVVLLQLSKSAKDVPDTAVFKGDLDQVRTIAEQEQPEYEPKADSIRGAAAIVRRLSNVRQKNELEEARRLHEEQVAALEPIGENEQIEWDGLRRRRTTLGTHSTIRSRGNSSVHPFPEFNPNTPTPHPPLGMSRFPSDSDSEHDDESRPGTASFLGTIRRSFMPSRNSNASSTLPYVQSPMHPVPLTEIAVPGFKQEDYSENRHHTFGVPQDQRTEYLGVGSRHVQYADEIGRQRSPSRNSDLPPTPPPHTSKRTFSFQNLLRRNTPQPPENPDESPSHHRKGLGAGSRKSSNTAIAQQGATEEERLGLVKGDTRTGREPRDDDYEGVDVEDDDYSGDEWTTEDKPRYASPPRQPGNRGLTPPKLRNKEKEAEAEAEAERDRYEEQRRKWHGRDGSDPPPPFDGRGGAFI
ncbi:magnesium transporter NIPA-domain-containing protein [Xylogone sp. PMI_703]|nr:magnesium transporter NIPA-domain-containing protein [Xylogone sp. PMI_703]